MTSSDSSSSGSGSGSPSSTATSPSTSPRQRKRSVRSHNSSTTNASKRPSSSTSNHNHDNNNCSNNKKLAIPLEHGCEDNWTWSRRHRSKEIVLSGENDRTVHFHPNWSKGTAGVQGERPLNNGRFYWELHVSKRIFGTSIMFGIGTRKARLHANSFRNILGENEHGWGLSHKGVLWHKGVALMYTDRFKENQPTVVGILFDGIAGTLTYYKDGECLGVAYRGLYAIKEPLYPIVCSTAAKTEMTLKNTRSDIGQLQDRCRAEVLKHIRQREDLNKLKLPSIITNYLGETFYDLRTLRQVDNYDMLFDF
ncbi:SPRY domain-containing SOCS box protein 3 [Musca domestica]|uniref:SPRY domain-containing SOCS box protein 3 n=1 Tax=Musca domestica TaxID=7370 RepID=A0A9J7DHY6_MUSDO|nr:SPRY domain-containing SOCS box protein 3 [Musca domestica]